MEDHHAWKQYPQHRNWFNKLWVSEKFGYECGPCGLAPDKSDNYIVRPIYNLSGMGVGAKFTHIEAGDATKVPPGYFWQEILTGKHYSVTYKVDDIFVPVSSYEGIHVEEELWRFDRWIKSDYYPSLPSTLSQLLDVGIINVEFKDSNPIEVHLRGTSDPQYEEIIPIWSDRRFEVDKYLKIGYSYINSPDDADEFLQVPRIGFMVK